MEQMVETINSLVGEIESRVRSTLLGVQNVSINAPSAKF